MLPTATIAISTKNRRDELRLALRSAQAQVPAVEVLVLDDGSTDGTFEMVRSEFPGVRIERTEVSRGYIWQRNLAARVTRTDVLVSIDDDAEFSTNEIVATTLQEFDDSRIGAVAIPFKNVNFSPHVHQRAPDDARCWVTETFIGTAYAVRRELFLRLGGFREQLVHQGEEGDFCIRMLEAGHYVRLGSAAPILHHLSPKRDLSRVDYYGARNSILYCWQNVPLPYFPAHVAVSTLRGIVHAARRARFAGLFDGYRMLASGAAERAPVRRGTYRLSRLLRSRGALDVEYVARVR